MIFWMIFTAMRHHAPPLSETLPAEVARVRFLTSVDQSVHSKGSGSGERLQAYFALIRPFAGVLPEMQLQQVIRGEILVALVARVSLGMEGHVISKIVLGGEGFPASVALVLLNLRLIEQHVLIEIASRLESFLAKDSQHVRSHVRGFVLHQQVVLQRVPSFEFSRAEGATIGIDDLLVLLVLGLVVGDILHRHSAESADVGGVHVRPVYVKGKVQLQFEPLPATVADEFRVYVGVLADPVMLQPRQRFVLHLADGATMEVEHLVRFSMLLEGQIREVTFVTLVAVVRLLMSFQGVLLHLLLVLETLLAERTNVPQCVQYLVHFPLQIRIRSLPVNSSHPLLQQRLLPLPLLFAPLPFPLVSSSLAIRP